MENFRIQVHSKEVVDAMMMLSNNLKDKAKLRRALKPAASHMTHKMRTRPVPKWLVTPSHSKSIAKKKGYRKVRKYQGKMNATVHSGNLRKSTFTVPNLKKLGGHVVGTRFLDKVGDKTEMGRTVANSSGWYQAMVHGGTAPRITKGGLFRGYNTPNPYIPRVLASTRPAVTSLMTAGMRNLMNKEIKRAKLG